MVEAPAAVSPGKDHQGRGQDEEEADEKQQTVRAVSVFLYHWDRRYG